MLAGLKDGFISGTSGALIGGIIGGIDAIRDKRNFWDGTICKSKMKIPQFNQYGPYDCRYEVFKSFDKCFNGSTKSTGSLRMTYPHVEVDQNMMRDMYAARRFNLKKSVPMIYKTWLR